MRTVEELPRYSGPAVVVGSAPSVREFNFGGFAGLRIGVGDMPWRAPELGPYDYWVTANNVFPLPWSRRHARLIAASNVKNLVMATAAFGGQSSASAQANFKKMLRNPNLPRLILFDQRHQARRYCDPEDGCCAVAKLAGLESSIQEYFQRREPTTAITYDGGQSVAFHGVALAVVLGANPVYIAGVELPLRQSEYAYYRPWRVSPAESVGATAKHHILRLLDTLRPKCVDRPSVWSGYERQMVLDLDALAMAARETGQELINTSPTSLLAQVPNIKTVHLNPY